MSDAAFLQRYAACVGVDIPARADEAGLRALHLAQAMALPFENLDPFLHRPVDLRPEAVEAKLLGGGRGGYCFELNSLFQRALAAAGFAVRAMTGRVQLGRPTPGPRTHHLLRVTIAGRDWLADAAFAGHGLRLPIPLQAGHEEVQAGETYRLDRDPDFGFRLRRRDGEAWTELYSFPGDDALPIDLEMGNHFTATHPASPFRRMLVCYRPTAAGRVVLTERTLVVASGAGRSVTTLEGADAALAALRGPLGLAVDAALERELRVRWAGPAG